MLNKEEFFIKQEKSIIDKASKISSIYDIDDNMKTVEAMYSMLKNVDTVIDIVDQILPENIDESYLGYKLKRRKKILKKIKDEPTNKR